MPHSIHEFGAWLATTPLSMKIQEIAWIIPATQVVHILCIALVISSVFMIDLRLLGLMAQDQPIALITQRFLPPIWCALPVLLLSGSILIIGEPSRSLENPAFRLKMLLLVLVVLSTLAFQRTLRRDERFWERSAGRRTGAKMIAVVSLALWVSIVCAGRWIAYVAANM